jgi:type I restriction enzyme S subunit
MKDWKKSELGNIAAINYGYTAKAAFEEVGPKFLRITDIQNDSVDWSGVPHCPIDEADFKKHKLHDQDIVFARTGATTGKSYLVYDPPESVAASYLIRLRVQDSGVSAQFVSKYFQTREYWDSVTSGISGSAQGGFNASKLSAMVIPIPPIAEQKQIVAILDEAFEGIDSAIANTEKNLANARELFESYLNAIFTRKGDDWVEKKLDEICSIKHGFAFKGEFFTNEETDYVVLTPGSFYESGGYRDQGSKTKYYTGEIPEDYILSEGDFLFAMTEQAVGLLGSSLIVPESDRFLHNQRLGLVQIFEDVPWHKDFFFHQFNTKRFRDAVQDTASGVKVRHTSPKKLGAIPVCFPSTVLQQQQVADKLNMLHAETQRLEAIYQQKLAALNELKQSILQRAFSGELTAEVGDAAGLGAKEVVAA